MIRKEREKKEAIRLRKQGKTYSEILSKVPVAKSTLALWLQDVGMAKKQFQRYTETKRAAGKRGGAAKKQQRIERLERVVASSKAEIKSISDHELFLIGSVLYWAEGAKEKIHRPGLSFQFGNMDPKMIWIMVTWLERVCKIPKSVLVFDLYLHTTHTHRAREIVNYWEKAMELPKGIITRVYFKRTPIKTIRKNVGETYFGLLRVRVPQSSSLVRKITGWNEGIYEAVQNKIAGSSNGSDASLWRTISWFESKSGST